MGIYVLPQITFPVHRTGPGGRIVLNGVTINGTKHRTNPHPSITEIVRVQE